MSRDWQSGAKMKSHRREDFRFVTGQGQYVDDLSRPGQIHMSILRSPVAHGVVRALKTSRAKKLPGIAAVLSGADLAALGVGPLPTAWSPRGRDGSPMIAPAWPALADGRVLYYGQPIVAVAAESAGAAEGAISAVEASFREYPAVMDCRAASKKGARLLHPDRSKSNLCLDFELGEAEATRRAMASAQHVVEMVFHNNRLAVCAIEPRAVLAEPDGRGGLVLHTATQVPHAIRSLLARILGMDEARLRVISPDVGGGFGGKMTLYPEDVLAARIALLTRRPVKWTASRSDSFLGDTQARDHVTTARLGLDRDGRIVALEVATLANVGAYLSLAAPAIPTWYYAPLLTGAYRVPAAHVSVKLVFTNTAPVDAYRGAGRPEASYVIERLMEEAACRLHLAPDDIRRRNFLRQEDYPAKTVLGLSIDCGDHRALLDAALLRAGWIGFPVRRNEARARGKLRGIGISAYLEIAGGSPSHVLAQQGALGGSYEAARLQVLPSGGAVLSVGTHSHGQSHETVFPRLVAERLGIETKLVQFVQGDTGAVPVGRGTFASRSLALAGSAISVAIGRIMVKMRTIAAELMEAPPDDIVFAGGRLVVSGTDSHLAFAEVARAAYRLPQSLSGKLAPGLDETAFVEPPDWTFPAGCHIVEVEVDPETGAVALKSVTAVDDVGNVIDPAIVEGQIHGGLVQGLGQAMLESVIYDGRTGQLLTGSFMDYAMPRATDLVSFDTATLAIPTARNPLGVKGCAESGTVGAPSAFMNAVIDALRPLGVTDMSMPATPFKIWSAIREAQARIGSGGEAPQSSTM